ncbi:glycosyltransferase [Weissella koreensis]|uniref:glycosyltransferase n=1 Tax=Weissella koreensis TaxID=165096 RepID=UPI0022BA4B9E|nr:glycosyltransferase [Weissella koreensis]MCZ9310873.1 glycosyltransferase [Weissella koreensis]
MKNIAVLMSTYNGEAYVEEQILSIFNQIYDLDKWNLELYVRDDGSSDDTRNILKRLSLEYNINVDITGPNLGFAKSFYKLLSDVDADYYFFADQDDIWLPKKIFSFLNEFIKMENRGEENIGIFSDALVANVDGKSTGMKLLEGRSSRIEDNRLSFLNQLFEFYAQGASMAINKSVINKLREIPFTELPFNESHDHFVGLVVSYIGYFSYIDEPTLLYRQTGNNTYGARDVSNKSVFSKLRGIADRINTVKKLLLVAELVAGTMDDVNNIEIYDRLEKINGRSNIFNSLKFFIHYRKYVSLANPILVSLLYGFSFRPNIQLHQKIKRLIDRSCSNENNMGTSTKL